MPRSKKYPQIKEVLDNEITFLKQADHPNILKLYGVNEQAQVADVNLNLLPMYAIELEYAEHGELFDIIQATGRFSEREARYFFHQLISALEYMNTKGFCHWDIKAENLLLDSQFNLKLADFGFSTNKEVCTDRVGTYAYMAPEVLKRKEFDGKQSDLFSAAVVLFIMVTQHPPFSKASRHDRYYRKVLTGDLEKFWAIHESKIKIAEEKLSPAFKDLFIKMIGYDVSKRLTIEEIKQHEWFKGPVSSPDDIFETFKARYQVLQERFTDSKDTNNNSWLLNSWEIPNDDDVKPAKLGFAKKGLQMKKYSEYFKYINAESLLAAVVKFAESNDIKCLKDSNLFWVHLESQSDDATFTIKVNILKNPATNCRWLELVKLKGDKVTFSHIFNKLNEFCIELESTQNE